MSSITGRGSSPPPLPSGNAGTGPDEPIHRRAFREFLTGFRHFGALFPLRQADFSSASVRSWAAHVGQECPSCGGFIRHASCPGITVPCAACVASPPFYTARSLFAYEGRVREVIRAAKYGRGALPAGLLAERLLEAIRGRWSDRFPDCFRPVVVPVPIMPLKYFRRGFNLPALVGSALARAANWQFAPRMLQRAGGNTPQAGLPLADREENVRGAFTVPAEHHAPPDVLLLDDVYTSGATAKACALALKTAGAGHIVVLTVARAVP